MHVEARFECLQKMSHETEREENQDGTTAPLANADCTVEDTVESRMCCMPYKTPSLPKLIYTLISQPQQLESTGAWI